MTPSRVLAVVAYVLAALLGPAIAQQSRDRVYVLHSGPAGGCPSLDWHIAVEPNGILVGMIAWNDMKTMARASGTLDRQRRTFTIKATELGGRSQKVEITGLVKENGWLVANIKGPNITCKAIVVPIYLSPPDDE